MADVEESLSLLFANLFDKKSAGSGVNAHVNNEKLAEEFHKPIIILLKKRTVYSGFKDNIWGADLADMQLITCCSM